MIDSHCHINDELYCKNPDEYVKEARKAGVFSFLIIGSNIEDSIKAVEIAESIEECYCAVGIHPEFAGKTPADYLKTIEKLALSKKTLAIGEIGLDYYWEKDPNIHELQKKLFIEQIELANKLNLPVSIHCRDALEDCLQILKSHPVKKAGVMHCYAGSYEMSLEFAKLGFVFGFGGTTTFKNSVRPKENAEKIPLEYILLETDAPYLTPVPFRGQPNHSKYLCYVRDEIAKIKNISSSKVDEITTHNFERIFVRNEKAN